MIEQAHRLLIDLNPDAARDIVASLVELVEHVELGPPDVPHVNDKAIRNTAEKLKRLLEGDVRSSIDLWAWQHMADLDELIARSHTPAPRTKSRPAWVAYQVGRMTRGRIEHEDGYALCELVLDELGLELKRSTLRARYLEGVEESL